MLRHQASCFGSQTFLSPCCRTCFLFITDAAANIYINKMLTQSQSCENIVIACVQSRFNQQRQVWKKKTHCFALQHSRFQYQNQILIAVQMVCVHTYMYKVYQKESATRTENVPQVIDVTKHDLCPKLIGYGDIDKIVGVKE